jgi:hypothetical protein
VKCVCLMNDTPLEISRIMPSHWNGRLLSRHGRLEKIPRSKMVDEGERTTT